jgi:basic membrane protein A
MGGLWVVILGLLLAACEGAAPATPISLPPTATAVPPGLPTVPAAGAKVTKIGFVTDSGRIDDGGYNQSIWEGVQQGAMVLGAQVKYIESKSSKDYEANIEQLVSSGYNPLVVAGSDRGQTAAEVARRHPDVDFIGIAQYIAPGSAAAALPNYAGLTFEEDKAGFLAGALAAQMSKRGQVGAVLGTDSVPGVWRFGEGYKVGARYIKPDIQVRTIYYDDVDFSRVFNDPAWGRATALSLIGAGADVIFAAAGNTGRGALLVCAEQRQAGQAVYAIGVDTDQYETVPEARPALLSSAMKLLTPSVAELIQTVADGTFHNGNNVGEVGLAPFHDFETVVPAAVQAQLQTIDTGLKNGTVKTGVPPTKPAGTPTAGATAAASPGP